MSDVVTNGSMEHADGRDLSVRAVIGIFVALLPMQAGLLYFNSFRIQPSGDDATLVQEMYRGAKEGPWKLVTVSVSPDYYRPIKSLVIWYCGTRFPQHKAF